MRKEKKDSGKEPPTPLFLPPPKTYLPPTLSTSLKFVSVHREALLYFQPTPTRTAVDRILGMALIEAHTHFLEMGTEKR